MYSKKRKKQAEEDFHIGQKQLAIAMDMAKLVQWEYDVETGMFTFDDHFYTLYGTTDEHESGPLMMPAQTYVERFLYPKDSEIVTAEIGKAIASTDSDYSGHAEHRIISANGQDRFVSVRYRIIKDSAGRTIRLYGALQDITEWKQAVKAIEESEEYTKKLFHSSIIPKIVMDAETGIYIDCNEAAVRIYGYANREEALGKTPIDVSAPTQYDGSDSTIAAKEHIRACWKDGSHVFEWRHQRPNGQIWDADVHLMLFRHRGKTLIQFTLQDITEHKKAEEALKEREKTLQAFFDAVHESMVLINTEGTVILSNKVGAQRLGKTVPELIGTCLYDNFPPDVARCRKEQYDKVVVTGEAVYFQDTRLGRFFEQYCYPVFNNGKNVSGVTIFAHEITDRKRDELALRKSEQTLNAEKDKLRTISDNAPFGMALIDKNGTFTYLNPTFREMFGYNLTEIPDGKTWFRKAYPDKVYRHSAISAWVEDFDNLDFGEIKNRTLTVACKNSTQKIVNFISLKLHSGNYLMTCKDVTELKRLEAQLRQSQKMEAIGTLAGGIAHDFNNILTTIIGYGSILQMDMDDENPRKQYLDQILASSQKAANLTQSLLAFSRKQAIELKPHSLNTILKGMGKLLKRLLTEDIEFEVVFADPDISIMADMTQIDQVLMNLVANARDSMPKGGELIIEVKNIGLDSEFVEAHGYGEPGSYALILISDTGCGMDEITREKIFEPFFTTKEVGRGTGLGLSIVYGIVKQHNGYINVYSEPGKGTVFKIYLPTVKICVEELEPVKINIQGGKETILVAEDNNALRILAKEVLTRKGYTVIEATNGEDAIMKFMERSDAIDLLFLDVVMPKMNGKEVHEKIRMMRPDIKALFTSGYTGDVVIGKGIHDNAVDFIAKPLSPNELLFKVREVLDR